MKNPTKPIVDILMTVLFLAQMAYHLEGNVLHEWLGTGLVVLFLLHQHLNRGWYKNLFRGKYPPARILMTAVDLLLLLMMLGTAAGGIMLSRRVFGFLGLHAGMLGRRLHMVCTAWVYLLMSIHLGLHWGMVLRKVKVPALPSRILTVAVSLYGAYALFSRQLPNRMFLRMEYAFFDYEEPALFFFGDYLVILVLFAAAGYYITRLLQKRGRRRQE
ncbi:MAG: DUF4405 domain-containing protein [Oscillospiraceae bacterium]|nr:DUF4405 domain-containing protein [Oscillospiraceae bacterium]